MIATLCRLLAPNPLPFPLSLYRVTHGVPSVPTPDDRIKAYRRYSSVQFGNPNFNSAPIGAGDFK